MMTHIYILRAPDSVEVRYVGATRCPAHRLSGHVARVNSSERMKGWLEGLAGAGERPVMETIEIWHDPVEAREAERFAIERLLAAGHRLLNRDMVQRRTRSRPAGASEGPGLLASWMTAHGATQEGLAAKLHVRQGAVHYWLTARRAPRVETAIRIEELTGIPVISWRPTVAA